MRVLVFGDLNLDVLMHVDVEDVSLKDLSYVAKGASVHPGGVAGNVSTALKRLGMRPTVVSCVGRDPIGSFLLEDLRKEGVALEGVRVIDRDVTGVIFVILRPSGRRTIVGYRGANRFNVLGPDEARRLVKGHDYVYVSGFTTLNVDGGASVENLVVASHELGVRLGLDMGGVSKGFLETVLSRHRGKVFDVFLNVDELEELTGGASLDHLERLARTLEPANVFLKMGDRGAAVYHGGTVKRVAAFRVRVVDTTGCGDAFDAGTLYGLSVGEDPVGRAVLGCALGAYKATGYGARHLPKDLEEFRGFFEELQRGRAPSGREHPPDPLPLLF